MDVRTKRKKRLEQLLELAQAYKGCSRKELARMLGRDRTKLVPASGVPKLDLVIDLCRVLDWSIGDVAGFLWPGATLTPEAERGLQTNGNGNGHGASSEYERLQVASRDAQRAGRYALAIDLAREAYAAAETAEERALACNREAVGWDGMGHYNSALEAEQRGLQEPGISIDLRRILESNLANAYYTLWSLTEARSLSRDLIDTYDEEPPTEYRDRCTQAFAFYVRGNTLRRMMTTETERAMIHAAAALGDLETSQRLYRQLAADENEASFAGIANTCKGGIIEVEAALERRTAASALAELADGLDAVVDPDQSPPGDWLESYGWWCIFGCNIALRHLDDERDLQHHMAVFTNKADEIADRMNNWSLRERVFTMQYASHRRFLDWTGRMLSLTLDNDDVRALVGTMGRFPTFRDTGWKLLQTARVVRDDG
jgi:tetratricopeptide (TPR) repeat protein